MTDSRTPIRTRFARHAIDPDFARASEEIRGLALHLAECIEALAPECPERDLAVDALDACVMWANAGIARHGASATPTARAVDDYALYGVSDGSELDETVAEALARAVVLDVGKAPLDGLRRIGLDAAGLRALVGRAGPQHVTEWRASPTHGGPVVWSAQTYSPDEVFAHLHGFFGLEAGA
jgi:hypothetical protein